MRWSVTVPSHRSDKHRADIDIGVDVYENKKAVAQSRHVARF